MVDTLNKNKKPIRTFIFILIIIVASFGLTPNLKPPIRSAFEFPHLALGSHLADFQVTECMKTLPTGVEEGKDVQCGYLQVPESHFSPTGKQIQLAVLIIKSKLANPTLDPLIMAQGGPGGSTIEAYTDAILTSTDFVKDRDIVLFDQRGTHYSKPNLYCEQIDQLTASTIEEDLSDAESQKLYLEALEKCRQQLSKEDGIDLSNFNSLENAEDIEALRVALGYDKINFYGVSYGTLLGLHYMRSHPESLRSVILDGVITPQVNFITKTATTMNQGFERLFETCKKDPDCQREYPELEQTFYQLVDQLNKDPAKIAMTDRNTGKNYPAAVINGTTFLEAIFQMLYVGQLIPGIPGIIYGVKDGKWDVFGQILSLFVFDQTMSYGMYYSVMCAEDADFSPDEADLTNLPPEIIEAEKDQPEDFLQECRIWNVEALGSQMDEAVTSSIPTLLLSGYFDPIAPPQYAELAAKTLEHSYHFIFPNGGHGQALDGSCPNQIIRDFLKSPDQPPDSSCIEQLGFPKFIYSDEIIDFPAGIQFLNFNRPYGAQLLVFLSALSFLLSAVPAIPSILLISSVRRRRARTRQKQATAIWPEMENSEALFEQQAVVAKKEASLLSRVAGWLAFFMGPILLVFTIGLTYDLIQMALTNDMRIYFGLDKSSSWLFILALIFAILGILVFIQAVFEWFQRNWSVWTRIYFSLIAVATLVCIILLAFWGAFIALI